MSRVVVQESQPWENGWKQCWSKWWRQDHGMKREG